MANWVDNEEKRGQGADDMGAIVFVFVLVIVIVFVFGERIGKQGR